VGLLELFGAVVLDYGRAFGDAGNRMTVVCEPCGRRGRYNVERLIAKHGDAKILYLLAEITACPKTQSTNIYDRCKAKYEGLTTR
jgi:hypothetical protein